MAPEHFSIKWNPVNRQKMRQKKKNAVISAHRPSVSRTAVWSSFIVMLMAGTTLSARASDLALDNVSIETAEKQTITIGHIDVTDTNLTKDELEKLFAANTDTEERKALLAKFTAARMSSPEIVLKNQKGGKIALKDFLVSGINAGKFEKSSISGVDGTSSTEGNATLHAGPISAEQGNLGRLIGIKGASPNIAQKVSLDNLELLAQDGKTKATETGDNLYKITLSGVLLESNVDAADPFRGSGHASIHALQITPPKTSDLGQQLALFGYSKLDFNLEGASSYDPGTKVLTLDRFELALADGGVLTLKGKLGSLDRSLFEEDKEPLAKSALLADASLIGVETNFLNNGLVEKILAFAGKQQGKSPDAIKGELGVMAAQIVPALLGSSPAAKQIGLGLAAFVASPTQLNLKAYPKGDPIKLSALGEVKSPAEVLTKLDISVTAGVPGSAAASATPQAAQPSPAAKAAPLNGLGAWNTLVGKSLTGKNDDGEDVALFVLDNGSIKQQVGSDKDTGKWAVKGEKVCFEFSDDEGETCYKILLEGKSVTFTDGDGESLRYNVVEGNPNHL